MVSLQISLFIILLFVCCIYAKINHGYLNNINQFQMINDDGYDDYDDEYDNMDQGDLSYDDYSDDYNDDNTQQDYIYDYSINNNQDDTDTNNVPIQPGLFKIVAQQETIFGGRVLPTSPLKIYNEPHDKHVGTYSNNGMTMHTDMFQVILAHITPSKEYHYTFRESNGERCITLNLALHGIHDLQHNDKRWIHVTPGECNTPQALFKIDPTATGSNTYRIESVFRPGYFFVREDDLISNKNDWYQIIEESEHKVPSTFKFEWVHSPQWKHTPTLNPGLYHMQALRFDGRWHDIKTFKGTHNYHIGTFYNGESVSAPLWQVTLVGRNSHNEYLYNFREYGGKCRCMTLGVHGHEWSHVWLNTCDNDAKSRFMLIGGQTFIIQSRANEAHFRSYTFQRRLARGSHDWFQCRKNGNTHIRFLQARRN